MSQTPFSFDLDSTISMPYQIWEITKILKTVNIVYLLSMQGLDCIVNFFSTLKQTL